MRQPTKPTPFQALKNIWYKKLANSGFADIEQDEEALKEWSFSRVYAGQNNGYSFETIRVKREAKEDYYRLAGHFLHENEFVNSIEKLIWELHGEGKGCRRIAVFLQNKNIKSNKDKVNEVINRLSKQMIAKYTK